MRKVNFTSLDLELNCPDSEHADGGQPKIIQVGAFYGNLETGETLEEFSSYVNPHEQLFPHIVDLCKIKQADVDNAPELIDVYKQAKERHLKYNCFCNNICWGQGDAAALRKQCGFGTNDFDNWCFGRREIDAKTLYISWRWINGKDMTGGLAKSLTKLGLAFQGRKHNATDDARNTFIIYRELLKRFKT
jgi:inhibitor of KinA sporulation pathway (predicted exonuclease)